MELNRYSKLIGYSRNIIWNLYFTVIFPALCARIIMFHRLFWYAKVPLLVCESGTLGMRKWHFGYMKVPLLGVICHWRMMFLALLNDVPCRHWREKTDKKANATDSLKDVGGRKGLSEFSVLPV